MAHYPHGVKNAAEVVALLNRGVSESTKNFDLIHIKEFPYMTRIPPEERDSYLIKNIMSMHSLCTVSDGLLVQHLTCLSCSPSVLCQNCENIEVTNAVQEEDEEYDSDESCDGNDYESSEQSGYETDELFSSDGFRSQGVV